MSDDTLDATRYAIVAAIEPRDEVRDWRWLAGYYRSKLGIERDLNKALSAELNETQEDLEHEQRLNVELETRVTQVQASPAYVDEGVVAELEQKTREWEAQARSIKTYQEQVRDLESRLATAGFDLAAFRAALGQKTEEIAKVKRSYALYKISSMPKGDS